MGSVKDLLLSATDEDLAEMVLFRGHLLRQVKVLGRASVAMNGFTATVHADGNGYAWVVMDADGAAPLARGIAVLAISACFSAATSLLAHAQVRVRPQAG